MGVVETEGGKGSDGGSRYVEGEVDGFVFKEIFHVTRDVDPVEGFAVQRGGKSKQIPQNS